MSDPRSNEIIERQLREAFRGALPTAPASLRDALERTADVPVETARGRTKARSRGWGLLAVAAVLLVGGAVAVSVGQRGPEVGPSPTVPVVTLTYDVAWMPDRAENAADIASVERMVRRRLELLGVTGASVQNGGHGRFVVTVPASPSIDDIRRVLASRGEVAGIPLGDAPAEPGDIVDLAISARLFGNDGIAGARIDTDQTGARVIELTLAPGAARDFEAWTSANIGKYFAIAVDSAVVTAPVVNSAIPGGHVQISTGGVGGWDLDKAREFVAIVDPGPLPLDLREVSVVPDPSARPSGRP
jgi:preprotein translocase subunit SecD